MLFPQIFTSLAIFGFSAATTLPIVDLGYVVQQASLNDSGVYPLLTFSNIRYADPPVGSLRFAAPVTPTTVNRTVNDGWQNVICPQATPTWILTAYTAVNHLTVTNTATTTAAASIPTPAAGTSEDCLFLDVTAPEQIYNSHYAQAQRNGTTVKSTGAPVLVWLYGGGYTSGDKVGDPLNDPATLVAQTLSNSSEGMIFVAPNYRLGIFGWEAGPLFKSQGGTPNAGLLDQRLALQWVQKYISLFGGDPSRVTVMGESAGAGSIMHHITAPRSYNTSDLFNKAIAQSPAFQPLTDISMTETYEKTLLYASKYAGTNITTLAQLQALPFELLYTINVLIVAQSPYGQFTFGPAIDSTYVPNFPPIRLTTGDYDKSISLISSHNSNEGTFFTDPSIQNDTGVTADLLSLIPQATNKTITHILTTLYPPIFTGAYPYTTQFSRASLLYAEFSITCNSYYLASSLSPSYKYEFAVPPGYHGIDVAFTFFNGDTTTKSLLGGGVVNVTVAETLQGFIGGMVMSGKPGNGFEGYEKGVYDLNVTGLGRMMVDEDKNERCEYWKSYAWL